MIYIDNLNVVYILVQHFVKLFLSYISSRLKIALALRTSTPGYLSDLLVKQTLTRRIHGPSQLMLLIDFLYLCIAESVPQVHPFQSQHLNCGIVYQRTSEAHDH